VHNEGSWEQGLEVMNEVLLDFKVNTKKLVIRDGSGISQDDLIPASEITKLLYHAQEENWYDVFENSLPVAGKTDRMVGGSLRNRMADMPVKAKTGTINGVSSLSGYAETKDGETVIFSILINNLLDSDNGPPIEDKIMKAIVSHKTE